MVIRLLLTYHMRTQKCGNLPDYTVIRYAGAR